MELENTEKKVLKLLVSNYPNYINPEAILRRIEGLDIEHLRKIIKYFENWSSCSQGVN